MTAIVIVGVLTTIAIPRFWRIREHAFLATLQSDLRLLAAQQELYQDRANEYAGSLGLLPDFHPTSGVTVALTAATSGGWAAVATHASLNARQCGLFYGSVAADAAPPATRSGVVTCN